MAVGDTPITIVGNIVADPELRFTPAGTAVANFRVASTPRKFNSQSREWEDMEALFLTCNVWRQAAENVAESLSKGMRVIVNGQLRQRSYQNREGENRTVYEVEVDEVGPSLKYATAQINRNPREGGFGGGSGGGGNRSGGFGGGNPGGNSGGNQGGFGGNSGGPGQGQSSGGNQSQPNQAPANDPWNSAPPAGGFGGAGDDEPPF